MATTYPVHVDATLEPGLNRWLWLVKWFLAIPHYVVLAFLWVAFTLLSIIAFFAILITGRYPRSIFEFNVGVLRWSWRVAYYTYGALGTDRYPPFSLYDQPDYPAHLDVEYPEHLSRGLVLVKWWLLALPHYLVVAFFAGGGFYVANQASSDVSSWDWGYNGGGLIGLLVFIAAVVLLVTGRYPQQIFDFVLGMNRWCLRVAAYAALMTDRYPPFRLDMGGADPGGGSLAVPLPPDAGPTGASGTPQQPGTSQPPGAAPTTGADPATSEAPRATENPQARAAAPAPAAAGQPRAWTAGRVVALVFAVLTFLVGGGLLAAGAALAVADNTLRDGQGFFMSDSQRFTTGGYAIASPTMRLGGNSSVDQVPGRLLGDAKLQVVPGNGKPVFVGLARTADADAYLAGVRHATVVDFVTVNGAATPRYVETAGSAPATPPGRSGIWSARTTATGPRSLTWPVQSGTWTVVVMNADGSPNVSADVAVGATVPAVGWVTVGLLVVGGMLLVVSVVLLVLALHSASRTYRTPAQPGPPAGPPGGPPTAGPPAGPPGVPAGAGGPR